MINLQNKSPKLLVIGDLIIDQYLWGSCKRISPEAPVPICRVLSTSYGLGGAANVAHNVKALSGMAHLAGIIGEDPSGQCFQECLTTRGISLDTIVVEKDYQTVLKTRVIGHKQHVVRVDHEDVNPQFQPPPKSN